MAAFRIYRRLRELLDVDLSGIADGDTLVYDDATETFLPGAGGGGGVTDHGALTGLGDDDHTQYHTDARGDSRYPLIAAFQDHSARHENGGADEISVAGLSGLLADAQTPATHAHAGEDITSGTVADARIAATIARDSEVTTAANAAQAAAEATAASALTTHTADTTAVHGITDTAAIVLTNDSRLTDSRAPNGAAGGVLGGTYPNPSFAADMATQAELDAHTADTSAAHAASAISFSPTGTVAATDVQAAIAEVASEASGGSTQLAYTEMTSSVSITGTTDASPTTIIDTGTITYAAVRYRFEWYAPLIALAANSFAQFTLWDGASNLGRLAFVYMPDTSFGAQYPLHGALYLTLTAGSHNFKLRAYKSGTVDVNAGAFGDGNRCPAWLRISTA